MAVSRKTTKRHLRELLAKFKFTYDEVGEKTGIDPQRIRAINKSEDPTEGEAAAIALLAYNMTSMRAKDTGETMD